MGFIVKVANRGRDHDDQKKGDDRPLPLPDHLPVVPEIDLFLLLQREERDEYPGGGS